MEITSFIIRGYVLRGYCTKHRRKEFILENESIKHFLPMINQHRKGDA